MTTTPTPYILGEQGTGGTSVSAGPAQIHVAWFGTGFTAGKSGSYSLKSDEAYANAKRYVELMNTEKPSSIGTSFDRAYERDRATRMMARDTGLQHTRKDRP